MSNSENHIIVFSDIHGCCDEFNHLLNNVPVNPDTTFIFLGDYIDRGENSKGVIDSILRLKDEHEVIALIGNHEQMFLHFIEKKQTIHGASFVYNGGGATLASYGNNEGEYTIDTSHKDFLYQLLPIYETEHYVFVHAGLPDIKISELDARVHEKALLWSRSSFLKSSFDWEKTIIHGHTPVQEVTISEQKINIDTGCVYGGKLTALELPSKKIYQVPKIDPIRHYYLRNEDERRQAVRFDTIIPVTIFYNGEELDFDTVNYSEFGMLICDVQNPSFQVMKPGETISGNIGMEDYEPVSFKGEITRHEKMGFGNYYSVKFLETPFFTSSIDL